MATPPPKRLPRILHVLNSARAEGTPRLVIDWLKHGEVADQGVMFLFPEPDDLKVEFARMGVWMRVRTDRGRGGMRAASLVQFTRLTVTEFVPDLVICWPMGFAAWVLSGCRLASKCRFLTHAGNPPSTFFFGRYVHSYFTFSALTAFDGRIVACSRYIRDTYAALGWPLGRRIGVVYNAIDARRFSPIGGAAQFSVRGPEIIMVGTLEDHKDQPTLIRAMHILKERGAKLQCRIVGAGRRRAELEALIQDQNVGDVCEILGSRNDVQQLLAEAKIFVLATTEREGRPGVLLEALASGLPIVASDVPPCRELLEDGRWGKLVAAGDPILLAEAIFSGLAQPPDESRRAKQIEFAGSFSVPDMIHGYLELSECVAVSRLGAT